MNVDALIDAYIQDVVRLIPRKQRQDVTLELRGLVREELQGRAASRGHPVDTNLTLEGLRAFGRPEDVAARYFEPWIIIPQTETRKFTFAAIVGTAVLTALSPLSDARERSGQLAIALLAWLGTLVTYFAIRSLLDRRRSTPTHWLPGRGDAVSRAGLVAMIAMIGIGIVAYGAPGWLFSQFSHGRQLPAWLDYDPAFHSIRLPVLFFLWGCQAFLLAVLVIRGRWSPALRRVDVGLEMAIALVLIWFFAVGHVFKEVAPNKVALSAISACALLLLIDVGVKLYRRASPMPPSHEIHSETSEA